jgi:hypothetical protein
MSNIQIARPPEGNYIPAFTVEKLEGTIKQKVYAFDERGVFVLKRLQKLMQATWSVSSEET